MIDLPCTHSNISGCMVIKSAGMRMFGESRELSFVPETLDGCSAIPALCKSSPSGNWRGFPRSGLASETPGYRWPWTKQEWRSPRWCKRVLGTTRQPGETGTCVVV